MGDSGVVLDLTDSYRYWPEGSPETGNMGRSLFDGIGLQEVRPALTWGSWTTVRKICSNLIKR